MTAVHLPALRPGQPADTGRATLGLLTANIDVGVGGMLWSGVMDAAERGDVNLVSFPGGELRRAPHAESARNALYELVGAGLVDGLVCWTSALGLRPDREPAARLYRRLRGLPTVSLAHPLGAQKTLELDSYGGMSAAISHLIDVHGRRRLAFIHGPAHHPGARERFQAYSDTLRRHRIRLDPVLVSPPVDFRRESGAAAIRVLLGTRMLRPGRDFDAVVACSDVLASGALRAMAERGVRVPADVAVVSLNDSPEARFASPPLTSVSMPFHKYGQSAVDTLLARLRGQPDPLPQAGASELVVRRSCGCPSGLVTQAAAERAEHPRPTSATGVTVLVTRALGGTDAARQSARLLVASLTEELRGTAPGAFLRRVEQLLATRVAVSDETRMWDTAIAVLRRETLPTLGVAVRGDAEYLLGQARLLVAETRARYTERERAQADLVVRRVHEVGQALVTRLDADALADALAERLPELGIPSFYLSRYVNPDAPGDGTRTVLAYDENGRRDVGPRGLPAPAGQLLPTELLPRHRRYSLVAEPLHFGDEQLGVAVFETGPRDGALYRVLAGQISSALKAAALHTEATGAREAAENANRLRSQLLANLGEELRTPLRAIVERTASALKPAPHGVGAPVDAGTDRRDTMDPPDARGDRDVAGIRDTIGLGDAAGCENAGSAGGTGCPRCPPRLLRHLHDSAEHQLALVDDLLDLCRSEVGAIELTPELTDPRALLAEVFHTVAAAHVGERGRFELSLRLPRRLPVIRADRARLAQIVRNLLRNARRSTGTSGVTLGAQVRPPHLRIWVAATGPRGVPAAAGEIAEPPTCGGGPAGVGLGLAISRRLAALHGGSVAFVAGPGGNTFHVDLPLPTLGDRPVEPAAASPAAPGREPVLLVVRTGGTTAPEVVRIARDRGLRIRHLGADEDPAAVFDGIRPAALAWDGVEAPVEEWAVVRRLAAHGPALLAPFLLYGPAPTPASAGPPATGQHGGWVSGRHLADALATFRPGRTAGSVLLVDDDSDSRSTIAALVARSLPAYPFAVAEDGASALALLAREVPRLVVLDLCLPDMDGFDVLDRMRSDQRLAHTPVLVLSGRILTPDDAWRLESHADVLLQVKGMLSDTELTEILRRLVDDGDRVPPSTSLLVKRTLAHLHRGYHRPLTRQQIAREIGVSEDYLSRVFRREVALSPWDYLNRLRVRQAKELLWRGDDSIQAIAHRVGFRDRAYFSRVFRRVSGVTPQEYREHPRR